MDLSREGKTVAKSFRLQTKRKIERQLLKLKGVKEITINPISHTVKIRYDPHVMTAEKMRSAIRKLGRT